MIDGPTRVAYRCTAVPRRPYREERNMRKLPKTAEFEGSPVISSVVQITNAGDGLSAAMQIAPTELTHGEIVHVVMECEVTKVGFKPVVGAEDKMTRFHVLRAGTATIVQYKTVEAILDKVKADLQEAEDAAHGREPFPTMNASTGRKGTSDGDPIPATS